jgi:hypothetical protein
MREGEYLIVGLDLALTLPYSEIEHKLKREVERTFNGQRDLIEQAQTLLFAALAADASWVPLYIHTNELNISVKELEKMGADLESGVRSVIEVRVSPRSLFIF